MTFAGLWEQWTSPDGDELTSSALLTCAPNDAMEPIHNRMPVILEADTFNRWLDAPDLDLLAPCSSDLLRMWPVTTDVENVRNNDPTNIEPVVA